MSGSPTEARAGGRHFRLKYAHEFLSGTQCESSFCIPRLLIKFVTNPMRQKVFSTLALFVISAPAHARDKFPLIAWLSAVHFINGPALEFGGSTAAVRPKAGVEGAS